jgi:triacylglycerol lipase
MVPIRRASFLALLLAVLIPVREVPAQDRKASGEPVVLLHGLALNTFSMKKIRTGLKKAGFRTCAIGYPSRDYPIDTLAARYILPAISRCFPGDTARLHFVTHSMGGILTRRLATLPNAPRIGRVVMIAPPNQGSEVVDRIGSTWWFEAWNGPAGRELGTDSGSMPRRLGAPDFEFGVIAATRSVDPLFSRWIPGRDDGKVAVEHTKLEGMRDFVEIPASHTMVLWMDETVRQAVHFLREGRFLSQARTEP